MDSTMDQPRPLNERIATFVFAIALLLPVASPAAERPNIVFFFTDDQTTSTLGCYGHPFVQTPNIDRLAARGTRFSNAFVSHSICWVSRTTILTGLTGRGYGTPAAPDVARPDAVETLYTDLLREHGYRTGFFGKWHAKMPAGFTRESHFDVFEAIGRNPFYKKQPDGSLRHETELIVDRGVEFIRNQPKDRPFALNLWFNACHAEDSDRRPGIGHFPWPRAVDGMYEGLEMPPPRLNAPAIFDSQPDFLKTTINRERFFWRWNTDLKYQINMRAYLRMVTGIDGAIGRFMKALEDAGLAENTIIVYSADNGYHMGNRGFAGKWSHYEESLRVPLIVADPRVPESRRGKVTDAPALNLDLPSTFLDWAGVDVPARYQGRSLKPIVTSAKPADWRTETFHEHFAVRNRIPAFEGLRNANFKYVRYFDHGNHEFLHNLIDDPDELINLANNPDHAAILAEMRARTTARVAELGGPLDPLAGEFRKSTDPHPVAAGAVSSNPDADGFVRVFDGRSLRQWSGDPEYWSVEDGALTGVTDGSLKANRFITWTHSTVRNFELRVNVKVSPGGNSGIQYRGQSRPDLGLDIVTGYQCDVVANTPRYNGMLYEEKGRRILSHTGEKVIVDPAGQPWIVDTMPVREFAADEWHDYRVLVRGNHHQHWIDGHPTANLIDLDPNGRALEGVLAVQVHVGPPMKIQFKDFKLKHLPDDLPLLNAEDHPIPAGALGVRPQGRLPADWKPPVYGAEPNGSLTIVALGDSTTAPRTVEGRALPVYADLLRQQLSGNGYGVTVVNAGRGSDTTSGARARLDRSVLIYRPDVVIVQFGINDSAVDVWRKPPASGPRVSLAEYEANLRHIIREIRAHDAEPVLMTPNPLRWTAKLKGLYGHPPYEPDDPDGFNRLLAEYADTVRTVAADLNVPLVDIHAAYQAAGRGPGKTTVDDLLLDGMHPSATGHELTARLLLNRLQSLPLATWAARERTRPKVTADRILLDARVDELPGLKMGPFVRLDADRILTVEGTDALVSHDRGRTWTAHPVFAEPDRFRISNERALCRTKAGTVVLAFMNLVERHWTWDDALGDAPGARLPTYVTRSTDDGKTWDPPQKMHDAWSGAVRNMIETGRSTLVFTAMQMRHNPGRHTVLTYRSTDQGRSWTASNIIDLGGAGHHGGVTEATIEEMDDGKLWMLFRTNWMEQWQAESGDDGRTWHPLGPSGIPSSSAPALLKRLHSGRLALLWNRPYPEGETSHPLRGGDRLWSATPVSNHRAELSLAFSEDHGRTWTSPVVIARKPDTWLAYPYAFEPEPGVLWITTMQGGLRVQLAEESFFEP